MREIKVRAWDNVDKRMLYAGEEDDVIFTFDSAGIKAERASDYLEDSPHDHLDHLIYMEYTGLKDKNGKEIYEGDILTTDLSRPYLVVEFRNGAFMYQCHDSGKDYYDYMFPVDAGIMEQDKYSEVIGNIYEHPHLLEGDHS